MTIRTVLFAVVATFLLAGCGPMTSDSATTSAQTSQALLSTQWQLVSLADGTPIKTAPQRAPTLTFNPNKQRIAGSGGCNRFIGGYTLKGSSLTFTQPGITMMACQKGMTVERHYMQALNHVASWRIDNSTLTLLDANGHPLARFEASTSQ